MSWIPLIALVIALVAAEILSLVTDTGFRLRRELTSNLRDTLVGMAAMERAGLQIRTTIWTTEGTSGIRRQTMMHSLSFWLWTAAISVISLLFDWPWYVPALAIAAMLAAQISRLETLLVRWTTTDETEQTARSTQLVRVVAYALLVAGILTLGWAVDPRMDSDELLVRSLAALLGLALLYGALRARQVSARSSSATRGAQRFGEDATKKEILLLRSFDDDSLRIRAIDPLLGKLALLHGNRARLEEVVASFLVKDNGLIAIGRPGEALPELGAARTYFADDEWQGAIDATARRAGAILMIAAGTGGFEWELDLLRRSGHLSKTLILVPPITADRSIEKIQDLFIRLGLHTLDRFDHDEWNDWVFTFVLALVGIGFSEDGRPVYYLSTGRDWIAYAATITAALGHISGHIPIPEPGSTARFIDQILED